MNRQLCEHSQFIPYTMPKNIYFRLKGSPLSSSIMFAQCLLTYLHLTSTEKSVSLALLSLILVNSSSHNCGQKIE